jgi:hypothetical protein
LHRKQFSPLEASKPGPPQIGQTHVGSSGGSTTPDPAQTGQLNVLWLPDPLQYTQGTCGTGTVTQPSPWQTTHLDISESTLYGSVPFPWQNAQWIFSRSIVGATIVCPPSNKFA